MNQHKMKRALFFGLIELIAAVIFLMSFPAYADGENVSLRLSTDKVFYTESDEIELSVKIILVNGSLNGASMNLSICDSKGNVVRSEKIRELLLVSTARFAVKDFPDGKYFVDAVLMDKEGVKLTEENIVFYKISEMNKKIPRLFLTRNGTPLLDGKPALLRCIWLGGGWEGPIDKKDLKAIADQGFDAVVVGEVYMKQEAFAHYAKYPFRGKGGVKKIVEQCKFENFGELLKALDEYKLGCFAHMGEITARFPELERTNLEDTGNFILKYRNDPAILGWYSLDETDAWDETNRAVYHVIKETDPFRPVWLNVIGEINANSDACDILSSDPYPVGRSRELTVVASRVSGIVSAQKSMLFKSPSIILQMFASPVEGWPRPPTPREERCMTYLALNHGAKSLGYFSHQKLETIPKSKRITPELWNSMKSLNAETKEMSIPYLLGERITGVSCNFSSIDVAVIRYQKATFLIAVNPSGDEITADFNVGTIKKSGDIPVKFESRKIPVNGGILRDRFLPYDVHIYTFE